MTTTFANLSNLAEIQFSNHSKILSSLLDSPNHLLEEMKRKSGETFGDFIIKGTKHDYVRMIDIGYGNATKIGNREITFTMVVSFPFNEQDNIWSISIPIIAKYDENANLSVRFRSPVNTINVREISAWQSINNFTTYIYEYLRESVQFNPIHGGSVIPPITIS